MPGDLGEEELQAHFATLPPRYFQIHSAREILDDLGLAHRFMRLQVRKTKTRWRRSSTGTTSRTAGYNAVKICTWDRAGLFSKIAGSFSAAGLNILSARIFTRSDGIALDTFFVTDARTGSLATGEQRDEFRRPAQPGADRGGSGFPGIDRPAKNHARFTRLIPASRSPTSSASTTRPRKRAPSLKSRPRIGWACFTRSRKR